MEFKTKIRTASETEVNKVLPVKTAKRKIRLGIKNGIYFPTHLAFKQAGISATVTYPLSGDNTTLVPSNPIKDYRLATRAVREQGLTNPSQIELVVEADDSTLDQAIALIQSGGTKSAAKKVISPSKARPSDEPQEKVISDQTKPVESKTAAPTVELDGKKYRLVPEDDEPKWERMLEEKDEEKEPEIEFVTPKSEEDDEEGSSDDGDEKESKTAKNHYIKKQGDEWVIIQKGSGKVLSHHDSKEEAEASFRAMMRSKHGDRRTIRRQEADGSGVTRTEEIIEEMGGDPAGDQPTDQATPEETDDDQNVEFNYDNSEQALLARIALADLAVNLGIRPEPMKMAFVAELEGKPDAMVEGVRMGLEMAKEAGLRRSARVMDGLQAFPRLEHTTPRVSSNNGSSLDDIEFEAVFLS